MAWQYYTLLGAGSDPTGALNTAAIASLWAATNSGEGIVVFGTPWQKAPMRAVGNQAVLIPANRSFLGVKGLEASLDLMSWDGAGTSSGLIGNSGGLAAGIQIANLRLYGGRGLNRFALGASTAPNIILAGQNDWSSTVQHNVLIDNVINYEPRGQAISLNGLNGWRVRNVINPRPSSAPEYACHHFDTDTTTYDKPIQNGIIEDSDLDSYGNECLKMENHNNTIVRRTTIRSYVSLVQDNAAAYSYLGAITFDDCNILAPIQLKNLRRRHIPAAGAAGNMATSTVTLSGVGTVGGTITATRSGTAGAFTGADVGKSIGAIVGYGFGRITADLGAGTMQVTVDDVFSTTSYINDATTRWGLAFMDNSGDGSVTWTRNRFGRHGFIWPQQNNQFDYGTQTIQDNTFDVLGNSYNYPAGLSLTTSGNAGVQTKLVKWVQTVSNSATWEGLGPDPTEFVANRGMWVMNAPTTFQSGVTNTNAGERLYVQNGTYDGTLVGNKSVSLGGKAIEVAAESDYCVIVDGGGGNAQFLSSAADPAGATLVGVVAYNFISAGSGAGFVISGTSAITLRRTKALLCSAANAGGGYRVSGTGACVIEDFEADTCQATGASSGGGVYNAAASAVFRRGSVHGCTGATTAGGIRNDVAGGTWDQIECYNNTATAGTGGFATTTGATTIHNLTAYGNTGTVAHDLSVPNTAFTTTIDSSILMSDNGTGVHAIDVGALGTLLMDRCTIYNGSGHITGAGTKTLTNITSSTSPTSIFVDAVGRNLQLKSTASSQRGGGVLRGDTWDRMNGPFTAGDQGAWAYYAGP